MLNYQRVISSIIFNVFLFILSLGIVGCGKDEVTQQLSAEEAFDQGMKKFNNEDYLEASDDFKVITLQYQGTKYADAAQYYMGECRYKREEYVLAAYEYGVLIRTMQSSRYASKSRFQEATCYYNLSPRSYLDQDYTRKAIDAYQAFLEYFPTDTLASIAEERINELNTKLAKKDYENGITYMHLEYYKSAAYYFDLVLEKFHDTEYAEPALLKKAEALCYRKKYDEAQKELDRFFEKYPSSKLKDDAITLQANIQAGIITAKEEAQKTKKETKSQNSTTLQTGS